jgi:hypothetical protein
MKLIFLNRFFHPDHSATSQLLSDLVFHLAAQGAKCMWSPAGSATTILALSCPP